MSANVMNGFLTNIEEATVRNETFRTVLFTGPNCQLVVMSLKPGEEIGMETHEHGDQFIRVEAGEGKVIMNGESSSIRDDFAFVIPAGTEHNVINTGKTAMKLYTVYSPPEHRDGTVHKTKADAEKDETDHPR